MAACAQYDSDRYWSDETCRIRDIPYRVKLPLVVKVTEGIFSEDSYRTFSQGDIIEIHSCQTTNRVQTFVAKWDGEMYTRTTMEIKIPMDYKGLLQVIPLHGVGFEYPSVRHLMHFFPNIVRTGSEVTFDDLSSKKYTLMANEILELLNIVSDEEQKTVGLRVRHGQSVTVLPRDLEGSFITVWNDRQYTIADVLGFQSPQCTCVTFVDEDLSSAFTMHDQDAMGIVRNYHGKVIVTGKKERTTVLYGSNFELPLDDEDVAEIEVQLPKGTETLDYEELIRHHFTMENTSQPAEDNVEHRKRVPLVSLQLQ